MGRIATARKKYYSARARVEGRLKRNELSGMIDAMGRKPTTRKVVVSDLAPLRGELFEKGSPFARVGRSQVVGIDSLVDQLDEIVLWLKHPDWFAKHDSRLEPGILFSGEPGTGKTLLARYLASCSEARFVAVRDWPVSAEMVTAHDVGELFRMAREFYAEHKVPVIIFWDEFEIYAKRRSEAPARDASVVSQLMSELDGINGKGTGILFIGCTNYESVIDPALKRHGRLGKHFHFVAPNRKGKMLLLSHYLGRHRTVPNLDLESATYFLPRDASAAAIEESCEGVWRKALGIAFKDDSIPEITQEILNEVLLEELLGPPPPFMDLEEDAYRKVALHEMGHALVAKALGVTIQVMTVRPGASTFGRVYTVSDEQLGFSDVNQIRKQVVIGLGAFAMEKYFDVPIGTGVEGDTKQATILAINLAERMGQHSWLKYGDWVGPVSTPGLEHRGSYAEVPIISPVLLEYFDREVNDILKSSFTEAHRILSSIGKAKIDKLVDRFVEAKTWTGKQFDLVYSEIVEGKGPEAIRELETSVGR